MVKVAVANAISEITIVFALGNDMSASFAEELFYQFTSLHLGVRGLLCQGSRPIEVLRKSIQKQDLRFVPILFFM